MQPGTRAFILSNGDAVACQLGRHGARGVNIVEQGRPLIAALADADVR